MRMRFLLALITLITLGLQAQAQVRPEDQLRAKADGDFKVNTLMTYGFMTDANEQERPRSYFNTLRLNPFFMYKKFNLSIAASARYQAIGNEIEASERAQQYAFQDIEMSLSRVVWADEQNVATTYVFGVAPTSQASQDQGINGVLGAGFFYTTHFKNRKYNIIHDLSAFGIANSYYYSTTSTPNQFRNDVNQSGGARYSLGLAMVVNRYISVGTSIRLGSSQFVDGSSESSFSNISRVNLQVKRATFYAFYLNGSYPDQTDIDLFYYDQYRQLVGAGINYVF